MPIGEIKFHGNPTVYTIMHGDRFPTRRVSHVESISLDFDVFEFLDKLVVVYKFHDSILAVAYVKQLK